MQQKRKGLPIYLGIASVWFGAHCGPGVASGNQVATYYSKFSKYGLFMGILAMVLLGICIFYAVEYSRLTKSYDFKSFTNNFFYPYEKFFSNFFEVTYVATVLMVVGSCIATGAQALHDVFGLSNMIGILILAGCTIALTIFGANLVRSSSTAMTLIILVTLSATIVIALSASTSNFSDHWNQVSTLPETLPKMKDVSLLGALWSAVLYAGFQSSGNMANVVSVVEGLESKKDSFKAAFSGVLMNGILILGVALMLFAYPSVLGEFFNPNRLSKSFIPNLVVTDMIGNPALKYMYLLVLLMAILSTLVGFAFAVLSRYGKYVPMKEGTRKNLVTVIILLILCALVSLLGLDAIVGRGFKYLAYANIVLVIIPTILIGSKKIKSANEENII